MKQKFTLSLFGLAAILLPLSLWFFSKEALVPYLVSLNDRAKKTSLQGEVAGVKAASDFATISTDSLKEIYQGDQVLVLDLSAEATFALSHINSAINIPFEDLNEVLPVIKSDFQNVSLILTCTGCDLENGATQFLDQGLSTFYLYKEGLNEWRKVGGEVGTGKD
ncbi:MAG: hypothetical protein A2Y57_03970 [Candidatus Woykebacteria bacterium RBG_13_40_7b]|uniref:Rhodanese domain-containing protein n=1 Tax=Candidatus Woykebacteria bacterium RBG_13_40_7b TaxID=1802594 RepID=A0A1G1W7U4_9BACT|nr:MAG: hypothetical protein A2Y57_03970 [Candidatus Woykebacteria bacterium RBG_13_40_7b]